MVVLHSQLGDLSTAFGGVLIKRMSLQEKSILQLLPGPIVFMFTNEWCITIGYIGKVCFEFYVRVKERVERNK